MKRDFYIRVRLSEQEKTDIIKLAKINNTTISELVRQSIYGELAFYNALVRKGGVNNASKERQKANN